MVNFKEFLDIVPVLPFKISQDLYIVKCLYTATFIE